ncbi:hypothetical protein VPHF86_0312 [Vibrio phage F86]
MNLVRLINCVNLSSIFAEVKHFSNFFHRIKSLCCYLSTR